MEKVKTSAGLDVCLEKIYELNNKLVQEKGINGGIDFYISTRKPLRKKNENKVSGPVVLTFKRGQYLYSFERDMCSFSSDKKKAIVFPSIANARSVLPEYVFAPYSSYKLISAKNIKFKPYIIKLTQNDNELFLRKTRNYNPIFTENINRAKSFSTENAAKKFIEQHKTYFREGILQNLSVTKIKNL